MAPLGHLSPPAKLVFLLMLVLSSFLFVLVIGMLLAWPLFHVNIISDLDRLNNVNDPSILGLLKFLQVLQSIGLFILPPLLAGFFFEKDPARYLQLKSTPGNLIYLLTFTLLFVSLPVLNWVISLNQAIDLPSALQGIERWMKEAEEQAAELTEAFLAADTFGIFLFNIFMIAVIPAIGEEFLFRGVIQRILGEWFRNVHVAIFVAAFFFAAIHMQFYGFIPRMMLGILFGYLFYWSGSLWLPVFAHFVNNASAVTASYLSQRGFIEGGYEDIGSTGNAFVIAVSLIASIGIIYFIYLRCIKERKTLH